MLLNVDSLPIEKRRVYLTPEQIRHFIEFDALARQMGLGIYCSRCTRLFGAGKDGVQGDSSMTTFRVYCGCTERISALAPTSSVSQ